MTLNAQNSTDQFLARLHDSLTASSSLCSSLTPGNFFSQVRELHVQWLSSIKRVRDATTVLTLGCYSRVSAQQA